jgi:F-type H+-transporting ATPase subunit b
MEILNVFGIEWKLIAIQMINFGLLLFILYRYAYKPLFALVEKRQQIINRGLEDAEHIKQERAMLVQEVSQVMHEAREKGSGIVSNLRKDGEDRSREIVSDAEHKAQAILYAAEMKAKAETDFILKQTEKELAKLMVLGAEKILRTK